MQIKEQVPLSQKTSYRIGGKSKYLIEPQNIDEVQDAIKWAHNRSLKIFILGRGSNILIDDSGWNGLTIDLSGINFQNWNDNSVVCGCGGLLHALVTQSVDKGFHGFEALAGIPGSIGGAIVMNAGAFGANVSDCLIDVTLINIDSLEIFTKTKSEMEFGYRSSILKKESWIAVEAKFQFPRMNSNKEKVKDIYNEILAKRKVKQPLNLPNCGSVFKRPENNYAGTLIEECGLKGFSIGGAAVSEKHANFIVNRDNATAEDVKNVIEHVQRTVLEKKGILLEREVIFVGDFLE